MHTGHFTYGCLILLLCVVCFNCVTVHGASMGHHYKLGWHHFQGFMLCSEHLQMDHVSEFFHSPGSVAC